MVCEKIFSSYSRLSHSDHFLKATISHRWPLCKQLLCFSVTYSSKSSHVSNHYSDFVRWLPIVFWPHANWFWNHDDVSNKNGIQIFLATVLQVSCNFKIFIEWTREITLIQSTQVSVIYITLTHWLLCKKLIQFHMLVISECFLRHIVKPSNEELVHEIKQFWDGVTSPKYTNHLRKVIPAVISCKGRASSH